MKKLLYLLICITVATVLFAFSVSAEILSGECGESATYSFDTETGVLTISGTGAVEYSWDNLAPWSWDGFGSQYRVKTAIVEDGITYLGAYAFGVCSNLETVSIPASVTGIYIDGDGAFWDCINLKQIKVSGDNQYYTSIDGVLYTKDMKMLIKYPARKEDTYFAIPDGVETILDFESDYLKEVFIPKDLATVNPWMFAWCYSLESFDVDDKSPYFADIEGVLFSKDGKILYNYPAKKSGTAYQIPSGTVDVKMNAFRFANLETLSVPASLERFYPSYTWNLKSISVSEDNAAYTAEDGVLFSKDKTELVWCPQGITEYEIPAGVREIGSDAFLGTAIKSIVIPTSVKVIGTEAFCESYVESVTVMSDSIEINDWAFSYCFDLTDVVIHSTDIVFSEEIFDGCSDDLVVTCHAGTEFAEYVESLGITVGYLNDGGCIHRYGEWIERIPATETADGVEYRVCLKCGHEETRTVSLILGSGTCGTEATWVLRKDGVLVIDGNGYVDSFYWGENDENNYNVTHVEIRENITNVNPYALLHCMNLVDITVSPQNNYLTSLDGVLFNKDMTELLKHPAGKEGTKYIIPTTVTKVAPFAFNFVDYLEEIVIPASVTDYGWSYCVPLKKYTVSEANTFYKSVDGILLSKDGKTLILNPGGVEACTIPAGVEIIADSAFSSSHYIVDLVIPDTVTTIGHGAFNECFRLESIYIPESVTSIGDDVFRFCHEDFVIRCIEGSYADTYANENGIPVEYSETAKPVYSYAVEKMAELGIMIPGSPDLDACITRTQLIVALAQILDGRGGLGRWNESKTSSVFNDVNEYGTAIDYVYAHGYISGRSADTFGIGDAIKYQDLLTIAVRILGYETPDMAYPYGYILAAQKLEITENLEIVNFTQNLTIGEALQLLWDMLCTEVSFVDPISGKVVYPGETGMIETATGVVVERRTLLEESGLATPEDERFDRERFLNIIKALRIETPDAGNYNGTLKRYQVAVVLAQIMSGEYGLDKWGEDSASEIFADVTKYGKAIDYTVQHGILNGSQGKFRPQAEVLYQEALVLMIRALGYEDDAKKLNYPYGYVRVANKLEITYGVENMNYFSKLSVIDALQLMWNTLNTEVAATDPLTETVLYPGNHGYGAESVVRETLLCKLGVGLDFGYCGEDVIYSFNPDDGSLLIFGSGEVSDAPWLDYAEDIKTVTIEKKITFIPDNAFAGCADVTLYVVKDSYGEQYAIAGGFDYVAAENIVYGDVDSDGSVTIRDAARILQYKAGWDVEIDLEAADVDSDGNVTIRDAARILQYKAGWDVTLG